MRKIFGLTLFLAMLLVAGCGVEQAREAGERAAGNGQEDQQQEPADPGTQAQAEPPDTEPPETTPEEPAGVENGTEETGSSEPTEAEGASELTVSEEGGLEEVRLTSDDSGSGEAAGSVSDFRMRMDEISLAGSVSGAPAGTEVGVFWTAVDVPENDYTGAFEDEVLYEDSTEVEGDQTFELDYEWEDPIAFGYQIGNDLPPGEYAAEVSLDGNVVETLPFTVYAPPLPVVAYPGRELPGAPATSPDIPATNLQFVVDASGSMNEVVGGVPKIEAARGAMQSLITALPDDAENLDVGLRAYSHREATEGEAGCEDTELLTPMDGVDKEAMRGQIDSLQAVGGRTPMAASVEQAAQDFSGGGGEENVVVLVSDGKENCDDDPVGAVEAAAGGANLTVHVVGFDITASDARDQLQQIAEATAGIYVDAPTPEELTEALYEIAEEQVQVVVAQAGAGEVLVDPPRGTDLRKLIIYNEEGDAVVEEFGPAEDVRGAYQLPAGTYTGVIETSVVSEEAGFRFEVGAGRETDLGLAGLRISTRQVPREIALLDQESARVGWEAYLDGGGDDEFLDRPMVMPPGTYTVLFQSSVVAELAAVAEDVEIQPNQVVTLEP